MKADIPALLRVLGIMPTGRNPRALMARCPHPDHDDKEPSWSILLGPGRKAGSHYCHGCSWGGGPAELVEAVLGLSGWAEAIDWIKRSGLELGEQGRALGVRLVANGKSSGFSMPFEVVIGKKLAEWVTPARRYAIKRGITDEDIDRWGLGYAVGGRLGGRIVVPIESNAGKLLGYSARSFDGGEPRYLGPIRKNGVSSGAVFGERWWPVDDSQRERVVVCEGVLDAMACARAGARHVAALDGSHVDSMQLLKLASFADLVVLTDSDDAGERAATVLARASRWRRIVRINLPAEMDAADMWCDDPNALRRMMWECATRRA